MKSRRGDLGCAGDLTYGLAQAGGQQSGVLATELVVVPSRMAYLHIPAHELRTFVDGLFPQLATNRIADSATGFGHRYRAGHDLLLDVPRTVLHGGPWEGIRHAGHILLTDFPTRAGIPIPGFSHSGLGRLFEYCGVSPGWLQLSLFDAGVGVFAFADGASTLAQALSGALQMDFGTACQTFGMGTIEIGAGVASQNPLLLAGGIQDVVAGIVSTWQTISVYVDPLDFFGAAGTSAVLGFALAYGLTDENLGQANLNAARSGVVGALCSVSPAFGLGAVAGLAASHLGCLLAEETIASLDACLAVDEHSFRLLCQVLGEPAPSTTELLKATSTPLRVAGLAEMLAAEAPCITVEHNGLVSGPESLEARDLYPIQYRSDFRLLEDRCCRLQPATAGEFGGCGPL